MSTNEQYQPLETPQPITPQGWGEAPGGYEGRRRKYDTDGMIVEGEHEVAMLFGVNGLQAPEQIDYTALVDVSKISDETRRYLDEAQSIFNTWEGEVPERAAVVGKIISVASRRDKVHESDSTKFRLFTEIMPGAQQERDEAEHQLKIHAEELSKVNHEFQTADQTLEYFDEDGKAHGILPDIRMTQSLIDDVVSKRSEAKRTQRDFHKRYLELAVGHKEDGSPVEPLSDAERDLLIFNGANYGPLDSTEADPFYEPGSAQEAERAKAVIMHIVRLYDAEIARMNAEIDEQRQIRDEANARKRQVEMERNARQEALIRAHRTYSDQKYMAEEAAIRYDEASKLPKRIIGKPEETFGDQVVRELIEEKEKAALKAAQQQQIVAFGSAGQRSEADRLAGRAPLAIEGAKVAIQGVAARIRIKGLSRTSEISIGYPKEQQ